MQELHSPGRARAHAPVAVEGDLSGTVRARLASGGGRMRHPLLGRLVQATLVLLLDKPCQPAQSNNRKSQLSQFSKTWYTTL